MKKNKIPISIRLFIFVIVIIITISGFNAGNADRVKDMEKEQVKISQKTELENVKQNNTENSEK